MILWLGLVGLWFVLCGLSLGRDFVLMMGVIFAYIFLANNIGDEAMGELALTYAGTYIVIQLIHQIPRKRRHRV